MSFDVCTISDEIKEVLKKYRFRRDKKNTSIILKIDPKSLDLFVEEELEDLQDVEELKDSIPETQPRFVLLSWCVTHSDGRVSYPMAFIHTTPKDCPPRLQMIYSGSYNSLIAQCGLTKNFQVRDLEELDTEWLLSHLSK